MGNGNELIFPITSDVWFFLEPSSEIEFFLEFPQLTPMQVYHLILQYDEMLVVSAKKLEKIGLAEELQSIRARAELNDKQTRTTFTRLGSLLDYGKSFQSHYNANPLFQSLEVICNALDKKLTIPPKVHQLCEADQLYAVSMASKLFYREVNLPERWWKKGCLPLLVNETHPPLPAVALPNSEGNYELAGGREDLILQEISPEVAEDIETRARLFYQPLPNKQNLNVIDILKCFSKSNYRDIFIIVLTSAIAMLVGVVTPYFNQILFDSVVPSSDYSLLYQILGAMFVIMVFQSMLGYVKLYSIIRFETVFSHNSICRFG